MGKLKVESVNGQVLLPRGRDGIAHTGFNSNWWLGLELLHTLFALEHNAICDALHAANPTWGGDQLFDTAFFFNFSVMS